MLRKKKIMLLGKSGSGKSALGNLILLGPSLGKNVPFKSGDDINAVTKEAITKENAEFIVTDTVGLFDNATPAHVIDDIVFETLYSTEEPVDVVLLLLHYGRATAEDLASLKTMIDLLGPECLPNSLLVFTNTPNYEDKEAQAEYLKKVMEVTDFEPIFKSTSPPHVVFVSNPPFATLEKREALNLSDRTESREVLLDAVRDVKAKPFTSEKVRGSGYTEKKKRLLAEKKQLQDALEASARSKDEEEKLKKQIKVVEEKLENAREEAKISLASKIIGITGAAIIGIVAIAMMVKKPEAAKDFIKSHGPGILKVSAFTFMNVLTATSQKDSH